jgi:hypothetical protein
VGIRADLYVVAKIEVPAGGSEGSQSRQTVKYGHESRGTRNRQSGHPARSFHGAIPVYFTMINLILFI